MWNLPGQGWTQPVSPSLAGGLQSTAPPGKSRMRLLKGTMSCFTKRVILLNVVGSQEELAPSEYLSLFNRHFIDCLLTGIIYYGVHQNKEAYGFFSRRLSCLDCKAFPKQLLHKIFQLYNINAHIPYARPSFVKVQRWMRYRPLSQSLTVQWNCVLRVLRVIHKYRWKERWLWYNHKDSSI